MYGTRDALLSPSLSSHIYVYSREANGRLFPEVTLRGGLIVKIFFGHLMCCIIPLFGYDVITQYSPPFVQLAAEMINVPSKFPV